MTTYFLDGYNVIHCSDSLRATAGKSMDSARNALIKSAADFCTQSGQQVVVVFDGTADPSMAVKGASRVGRLRIVYCKSAMSADTYIERAVYQMRNRLDAAVVTADNTVAQLVRGLGALVLKPQSFIDEVQKTLSETRGRRPAPKGHRFGTGLSDRLGERSQAELEALRAVLPPQEDRPRGKKSFDRRRAGPKTGS